MAEAFVNLFVGTIFVVMMLAVNVLAMVGIAVSIGMHGKGRRLWAPIVPALVLAGACVFVMTAAPPGKLRDSLASFMLHGTLLPVVWLLVSVVSPLTARTSEAEDLSSTVRGAVMVIGGVVALGWFGFVTISTGSLQGFVRFMATPHQASSAAPASTAPLEISQLWIGDGYGCAKTNQGQQCWPNAPSMDGDSELAMWGSRVCTGDMKSVRCWDLKTDKRLRKIPHWASRALVLGPGGGCLSSMRQGILCWKTGGPVQAVAVKDTLGSLAVGRDKACARIRDAGVACWPLGDVDAPDPVPVAGLVDPRGDVFAGDDFFCAQSARGLECWGAGRAVLSGPREGSKDVPLSVGKAGLEKFSVGAAHACGIDDKHRLWCWGSAQGGALGNGIFEGEVHEAVRVEVPGAVKTVHAGHHATCIELLHDVERYCWGSNDSGQLPVAKSATKACGSGRCVPSPTKAVVLAAHDK